MGNTRAGRSDRGRIQDRFDASFVVRRLLVAALALVAPFASAGETYAVLLDWQHGDSIVGTTTLAMSPLAPRFAFDVDDWRREILVDLLYSPTEGGAAVPGVGQAFIRYDFLVEIWSDSGLIGEHRIREPAYGARLGVAPTGGPHEVRLSLANGANVSWDLRVRGHAVFNELACEPRIVLNEIEANPPGTDAGREWVEIHNAGSEMVDLFGWRIRATHGAPAELVLGPDSTLAAGERMVLQWKGGQALDNEDEIVELVDEFGRLRDVTPALTDTANDVRTWQRATDGSPGWVFASGTRGASNG